MGSSVFDSVPSSAGQLPTTEVSQRVRAANLAERYYQSTQYDGLSDWYSKVALRKKKPLVIIPLHRAALDTIYRFTWGGSRFPKTSIGATRNNDEKPTPGEIGPSLYAQDAADLTTFALGLIKTAQLDRCAAEYSRIALVSTSCAVILGTRGGYLTYAVEPGKHCTPTFDPNNPRKLAQLEIVYQFDREEPNTSGGVAVKRYWFRRTIDAQNDTVYKVVPYVFGVQPQWFVDPANSTKHGLGFCPVAWVRTLPMGANSIDGQPVIDPSLYPLLDQINYLYSQRTRAINYILDPQWVRKNVNKANREDLEKNPSKIWDIETADKDRPAGLELVEAKGTGSDAASAHLVDLRARFLEAIGVVIADKSVVGGNAASGVVLEYLNAPMIALASDLRKDFGDCAFSDVLNIALRICAVQTIAGNTVMVQGVGKATDLMVKAQLNGAWLDFPVVIQWPRFFAPTAQDVQFAVQAANAAKQGGLIQSSSATRYISEHFGIADIDAEQDAIDTEKAQQPDYGSLLGMVAAPPDASQQKQPGKSSKQLSLPVGKPSTKPKANPSRPGKA